MPWFKRQNEGPNSTLKPLGRLESEVMEHIWLLGETSVRDLHSRHSSHLAYTTIMTTLDRLYKKGLLQRRKVGKAYLYAAAVSENDFRERLAQHFIGMALHDGSNSHAVLSCFVDAITQADRQMLGRLDQLVKAKRRALRRQEPKP